MNAKICHLLFGHLWGLKLRQKSNRLNCLIFHIPLSSLTFIYNDKFTRCENEFAGRDDHWYFIRIGNSFLGGIFLFLLIKV